MNTTTILRGAAAGCAGAGRMQHQKEPQLPARQPADVKAQIQQLLPAHVTQKSAGPTTSIPLRVQHIDASASNICAVIAVTDQESNFSADATVPGLPKIALGGD